MHEGTREQFFRLLNTGFRSTEFRQRLSVLLSADPFFIPGYLEHIWYTQKHQDTELRQEIISHTKHIVNAVFADSHVKESIRSVWTSYELDALKELLALHIEYSDSFWERMSIRARLETCDKILNVTKKSDAPKNMHLRLVKTIDPSELSVELDKAPFWWNINIYRSLRQLSHHTHTHALYIRERPNPDGGTEEYIPYDGVHESYPCMHANLFPQIHDTVLTFAEEQKLALGRVAIVRLRPRMHVYRHYDYEEYLKGRKRYHLCLKGGSGSLISAGPETVYPQPGEIWFFNNKVMHRAQNKSDDYRINIIFDGYPLSEVHSRG